MSETVPDTIAAIATAPGDAGLAIVRMSGPASLAIADRIFRCHPPSPSQRPGGTFVHGFIRDAGKAGSPSQAGNTVDEVVLLIYRAPHSYTREDVVEIQGHGGKISAARILRRVLNEGARLAEPGEFTKRAFLSGRIDLVQAEAVADLIAARSEKAAEAALDQLEGSLSGLFNDIYNELLRIGSTAEACLDLDDADIPSGLLDQAGRHLGGVSDQCQALLSTWSEGHVLRDGALVVISGKPNAGKSTLLNALLGKPRAIVTEVPGTTRDILEEQLVLNGWPVRLVDTAGIRETDSVVEQEGVSRAMEQIRKADVNIHMMDQSQPSDRRDLDLLNLLSPEKALVILNKMDLPCQTRKDSIPDQFMTIECSLSKGAGLEMIREGILSKIRASGMKSHRATVSERHRLLLERAARHVRSAQDLLDSVDGGAIILAASEIREAMESIGKIIGRSYNDELLSAIFSRFCVGK